MPRQKKIAFQGEPGANSHLACNEVFPAAEAVPHPTFEDCFVAVEKGKADLAMIPIENSLHGRITDIHHLLPTSGLHIVGEHFLPIHFQLMAPPGARLAGIRFVHSQVPALGQCRKIIREQDALQGRRDLDEQQSDAVLERLAQHGDALDGVAQPRGLDEVGVPRTELSEARHAGDCADRVGSQRPR